MAHASVAGWRPSICRSRQLTPKRAEAFAVHRLSLCVLGPVASTPDGVPRRSGREGCEGTTLVVGPVLEDYQNYLVTEQTTHTFNADGERTEASMGARRRSTPLTTVPRSSPVAPMSSPPPRSLRATATGCAPRPRRRRPGRGDDAKLCLERTTSVPELLMDFEQRLSLRTERDPDRAGQSLDRNRPITCRRRSLESAGAVISSSGSLNAWTSYDAESDPETTRGLTSHSYTPIGFAQGLHRPDGVLGRCRVRIHAPNDGRP